MAVSLRVRAIFFLVSFILVTVTQGLPLPRRASRVKKIAQERGWDGVLRWVLIGVSYTGSTHALGACRLGSIPSTPTIRLRSALSLNSLMVYDKKQLIVRNETLQGPAPACLRIFKTFPKEHVYKYIDGYYQSLLAPELSRLFHFPENQIAISNGAEDFLRIVFDSLHANKDSVLLADPSYIYYRKYLERRGIAVTLSPLIASRHAYAFDVHDLLTQYKKTHPRLILLTSPNNPTGHTLAPQDLRRILKTIDAETLVAIDEAYFGFDTHYEQSAMLALVREYEQLMLIRSFSKLYALAGLRIGFALCGARVFQMLRYEPRYLGLSRLNESVALAAVQSPSYYKKLSRTIIADREWLRKEINTLHHFFAYSSAANFLAVRVDERLAPSIKKYFATAPIVLGKFFGDALRVSVAPRKYLRPLLTFLKKLDRSIAEK